MLNPILQLAIMPLSYRVLGAELFGLWMLLNSIIAASGLATLGMGEAVTRYIAQYSAARSAKDVLRISRCIIALFMAISAVGAVLAVFFADPIVHRLSGLSEQYRTEAIVGLRVAGLGLIVKFLYTFLEAALRGYERYDIESSVGAMVAVATTLGSYGALMLGFGLSVVIGWGIFVMLLGAVVLGVKLHKLMPEATWWRPLFDVATFKEVARFGVFIWWQTLNGLILYQLDRVVIAIAGGVASVGYYSLCIQLIQTVHSVLAKGAGFVFPSAVKLHGEGDRSGLWRLFARGGHIVGWISWIIYAPLVIYAGEILGLWMGNDFASDATSLLQILGVWGLFMSTSILPFYLMNATGAERLNAYFGTASAGIFVIVGFLAVPHYAALGAAIARLSTVLVGLVSRTILFNVMQMKRPALLAGLTIVAQVTGVSAAGLAFYALKEITGAHISSSAALLTGTAAFAFMLTWTNRTIADAPLI